MSYILPTVGAAGIYQLKEPFNTALTAGVSYTCLSIRSLADLLSSGMDPLALYYAPVGLSQEQLNEDLAAGASIVGLQSGSGDWVYVPASYIATYPNGSGVPYTAMMVAVSLGALPDEVSLTGLETELVNTCLNVMGIQAAARTVAVSKTQLIDDDTHATLETVRINRSTIDASSAVKIADLTNQLQLATAKITALETYIRTHMGE